MLELTNTAAQTIAPGAAVTFNKVLLHTGCGECFDCRVPTSVKLTGRNGVYRVEFSGNIASGTAGTPAQLAIALSASSPALNALPETVMLVTTSAANSFNNVATSTLVKNNCCDFDRITVVNTGTTPVLLSANFNLNIERKC